MNQLSRMMNLGGMDLMLALGLLGDSWQFACWSAILIIPFWSLIGNGG